MEGAFFKGGRKRRTHQFKNLEGIKEGRTSPVGNKMEAVRDFRGTSLQSVYRTKRFNSWRRVQKTAGSGEKEAEPDAFAYARGMYYCSKHAGSSEEGEKKLLLKGSGSRKILGKRESCQLPREFPRRERKSVLRSYKKESSELHRA